MDCKHSTSDDFGEINIGMIEGANKFHGKILDHDVKTCNIISVSSFTFF